MVKSVKKCFTTNYEEYKYFYCFYSNIMECLLAFLRIFSSQIEAFDYCMHFLKIHLFILNWISNALYLFTFNVVLIGDNWILTHYNLFLAVD